MASYRFGPFELNAQSRVLTRDGEAVPLTSKVLETLLVLVENRPRVLTKDELLAALWPDTVVEEANLTQNVSTLRKALGDSPKDRRYIATIPGRGYSFVAGLEQDRISTPPKPRPAWFAAVAVLIPLTGLVALSLFRNGPERDAPALQPVPFTTLPGLEYEPAFSPDGRQLAYLASEPGSEESAIYVKLIGAGTQMKLTSVSGRYACPTWSPDGRYVAFWRRRGTDTGYYLISALGGPERRIAAGDQNRWCAGMDWFPNGKELVLSETSKSSERSPLIALNVETGDRRPLTSPPSGSLGDTNPLVSPDGRTVSYIRSTAVDSTELRLMPADGGPDRVLPVDSPVYFKTAWTPDSREIVFSSPRRGCCGLWRVPVSGGTPRAVLSSGQELADPVISHRGERLAYTLPNVVSNVWFIDIPAALAGRISRHPIVSSTRRQSDPQFSPDGSKIAFWSDRSGSNEIWVSGSGGESPVQLTNFAGPHTGSPRWSPDGTQIVFDSRPGANPDIFVVRADGGAPRRLTTAAAEDVVPSWSRDGKWIYFSSNRGGEFQIWRIRAAVGETASTPPEQVTRGGGFGAFESADGSYLYYAKGRGKSGLRRLRLSGAAKGTEDPRLDPLQHWGWWALGSNHIYYVESEDQLTGDDTHLKTLDLRSGSIRELAVLEKPVSGGNPIVAVSPDETTLAYSQFDRIDSDIMLVENFK